MGWQCIEDRLSEPREAGSPAIIPYLTVGFPDVATTLEMAPALEEAGAAVIELGVPFSDPLADGPTVQQCGFHALRQGVTLRRCLEACATLRARGLTWRISATKSPRGSLRVLAAKAAGGKCLRIRVESMVGEPASG